MEIKRFLDKVASSEPTPGGGSVSALAGALSASLVSMVAGLSPNQKGMAAVRRKARSHQKKLFKAIEEDARGYQEVLEAFRLPKKTEKERLHRSKSIQKTFQGATVTPRRVCELSLQLLDLSRIAVRDGNPNALSDAAVGAYLADASLRGGLLNIWINLGSVKDKAFVRKMQTFMTRYEKKRIRLMERIEKALRENTP